MVIIDVPEPKTITKYSEGTGTIDRHIRIRADKLRMDHNLAIKYWTRGSTPASLALSALTPTFLSKWSLGELHHSPP